MFEARSVTDKENEKENGERGEGGEGWRKGKRENAIGEGWNA